MDDAHALTHPHHASDSMSHGTQRPHPASVAETDQQSDTQRFSIEGPGPQPVASQCWPVGQSVVVVHVWGKSAQFPPDATHCAGPSTEAVQPQVAGQSPEVVQAMAQVPLPRHCRPPEQAGHEVACPQVLATVPQR